MNNHNGNLRTALYWLVCSLLICTSISCAMITPNGVVRTDEWQTGNFTRIKVDSLFNVTVIPSVDCRVVTNCDTAIWDYVEVNTVNNVLTLSLKSSVSILGICTIQAEVYMPSLSALILDGASRATVGEYSGETVSIVVNGASLAVLDGLDYTSAAFTADGASDIKIASLESESSSIHLDGASDISISLARIGNLSITADGASSLRSTSHAAVCNQLEVNIGGASNAAFDADVSVSGSVHSASTLYIGGTASSTGVGKDLTSSVIRR